MRIRQPYGSLLTLIILLLMISPAVALDRSHDRSVRTVLIAPVHIYPHPALIEAWGLESESGHQSAPLEHHEPREIILCDYDPDLGLGEPAMCSMPWNDGDLLCCNCLDAQGTHLYVECELPYVVHPHNNPVNNPGPLPGNV